MYYVAQGAHRVYVPNAARIRTDLMREFHATPIAGHFGHVKVYHALAQHYWPLVPPYRAGPMSTAGDCPETRGSLVWVERIGCDGAICAAAGQTPPPPYQGCSERLCRR